VNDAIDLQRRIRPAFVKGSALVALLLLPFLIHAVWGYVETRRLSAAIQSIEANGEPTRLQSVTPQGEAAAASRYYRAAAALASDFRADPRGWSGELTVAERTGDWPEGLVAKIRAVVAPYEEMLRLVDRAADLPFDDFGPGTTYNYLAQGLINAIRISSLRAVVNAFEGDGAGAARSLISAVQAGRWFQRNGRSFAPYAPWFTSAVDITFDRVAPGDADLERLARALADADDDDVLRQWFMGMRAGFLSQGAANPWFIGGRVAPVFVVDRPWRTHQVNRQLRWYAEVLKAVDAPWPDRIDAVGRVEYFNLDRPYTRERMLKSVEYMVTPVAILRSLRAAVAIERYRRGHSEQLPVSLANVSPSYLPTAPIDPFTGQPLDFRVTPGGYTVYSAGVNRRDDGGDVSALWAGGSDLGISVRHVR
jgi:hypothetical protein